jgi:rod shape-determining protein MreD
MRFLLLAAFVYAAAVLQTSLAPELEVRHVVPDLFALLAVLWQLNGARSAGDRGAVAAPPGFIVAALVGLAYDLTSSGPLGAGFGLFAVMGVFMSWIRAKTDLTHPLAQLAIVLFVAAIVAAADATLWRLRGETSLPWATLAVRAACVGVYTAGVAVPIVMVVDWFRGGRLKEANP